MKNTTSKRWWILASPRGDLTARPADWFRRFPNCKENTSQRLIYVRLPAGRRFEELKDSVYGWAVHAYRL
ncbi:MAG TPA: hypothetical protein PK867_24085 [Pirellulales bacterium]|nr:hypothetical protein [Pirellulales bacterium]